MEATPRQIFSFFQIVLSFLQQIYFCKDFLFLVPNGYLHIGHAKSICLNFGLAKEFNGKVNLRFDDTNPLKEDVEYVNSIKEDVKWLGFDWDNLYFASDYFEEMYNRAVLLIKKGKALI